jgi:hypothetical protein
MMKLPGERANAEPIAMGSTNAGILVHRDHPSPPCSWSWCTSLQEVAGGGPVFDEYFWQGVGPNWTSITNQIQQMTREPPEVMPRIGFQTPAEKSRGGDVHRNPQQASELRPAE